MHGERDGMRESGVMMLPPLNLFAHAMGTNLHSIVLSEWKIFVFLQYVEAI